LSKKHSNNIIVGCGNYALHVTFSHFIALDLTAKAESLKTGRCLNQRNSITEDENVVVVLPSLCLRDDVLFSVLLFGLSLPAAAMIIIEHELNSAHKLTRSARSVLITELDDNFPTAAP